MDAVRCESRGGNNFVSFKNEKVESIMSSSLAGRAYIVTGGAAGIGLAAVRNLLNLSATVHVVDRVTNPPDIFAGRGQLHFYPAVDVSSRSAVGDLFQAISGRTPSIHGLVNAAGVSPSGNYEIDGHGYAIEKDATYDHIMDVNSRGTWNVTNELLRYTLSRQRGDGDNISIVNIGSLAALAGFPTMTAYTVSKHAVLGMTRTWALEYARHGIRANMIAPGLIKTQLGMLARDIDDERGLVAKAWEESNPMGRAGEPEDVAGPIMFFLGDESSYITGEVLAVSGGAK